MSLKTECESFQYLSREKFADLKIHRVKLEQSTSRFWSPTGNQLIAGKKQLVGEQKSKSGSKNY